jgi:hypothetical protein
MPAIPRTDYSGLSPAARYSHELDLDPNFQIPEGYHVGRTGRVQKKPTWFERNFVDSPRGTLGIMAGLTGLGFLPGGAFAGGAGAGAGAGTTASTLPGTTAGGAAATGAGAAGAAGGGGMWGTILKAALPLILGQVAGRQSRNAAGRDSAGARLQDILPLLMPMIQQQQQQNQSRYAQVQPLHDVIARSATGLMPRHMQGGQQPPRF